MIIKPENMRTEIEDAGDLGKKLNLQFLLDGQVKNVRTFAKATLEIGAEVKFHVHNGESETYYILSGCGTYNDNGKEVTVSSGDITFTADGEGHGLRNNGTEPLEFIALIVYE